MKEDFLHFVWKTKNFSLINLCTTDGKEVQIQKVGNHNFVQGPDFLESEIIIDGIKWFGAVEIHLKTSDWESHQHQSDTKYQQVILHVVFEHNRQVNDVPVLVLKNRIHSNVLSKYSDFMDIQKEFPCESHIGSVDRIIKEQTISRMLIERLDEKAEKILNLLKNSQNDWEQTSLEVLVSQFGFNSNKVAFESLSKLLKFRPIYKHQNQHIQIQSIVFGCAGLLIDSKGSDPYYSALKEEYNFLSKKYGLTSIDPNLWNFGKLRPSNFPGIRLAQLSSILTLESNIYSKFMEIENYQLAESLFKKEIEPYWKNHYHFGKIGEQVESKSMGASSVNHFVINVIAPILFASGTYFGNIAFQRKAISLLESTKPENNGVTKKMKLLFGFNRDASDSQSLLYLNKYYCSPKRCLSCNLGGKILNS